MNSDRLRCAASDDADAIAAVHVASWHETYDHLLTADQRRQVTVPGRAAVWRTRLPRAGWSPDVMVIESAAMPGGAAARLTGFVWFGPATDADDDAAVVGHIESLHVDPVHRGRGFGKRLADAAVHRLVDAGYEEVSLWVVASNSQARGFYHARGWRPDGARRRETLAVGDEDGPVVEILRLRADPAQLLAGRAVEKVP